MDTDTPSHATYQVHLNPPALMCMCKCAHPLKDRDPLDSDKLVFFEEQALEHLFEER